MLKLSKETPSQFIVFDLLVDDTGKALVDLPLGKRRPKLESFAKKYLTKNQTIELSPKTSDVAIAREWLSTTGIKLDGVIAKRLDLPYRSGERDGMQKVKRMRTADCVVGGFRYASKGKWWAPCCSAYTMSRDSCTTVASPRASTKRRRKN